MQTQRKTYTAPALAPAGDVVDVTRTFGFPGTGDPDNPVLYRRVTAGSVGFLL